MLNINREKARSYGLSTGRIAGDIRTAIFGKEISKYKEGEDEFPINLRFSQEDRYDRKDMDRAISIYSNVIPGYNGNEIVQELRDVTQEFAMPEGYSVRFTGEQEEQEASSAFLMKAMMIAVFLIFLIIVTQFNSIAMPLIIVLSVVLSTIGVFLGYVVFKMDFIVLMTGIGIISLAGIVVNNAIVLIDYINLQRQRKRLDLGLTDSEKEMSKGDVVDAIVEAGATRLRPVLLTAITTILGLIPLAIGFNIDFATLLSQWNPNIWFGGDNVVFWGPMAWSIIFGLTFATFLTLVIVPVMYYLIDRVLTRITGNGLNTAG